MSLSDADRASRTIHPINRETIKYTSRSATNPIMPDLERR
jgi:hypothetical protein